MLTSLWKKPDRGRVVLDDEDSRLLGIDVSETIIIIKEKKNRYCRN